jgi:hypothetical protein
MPKILARLAAAARPALLLSIMAASSLAAANARAQDDFNLPAPADLNSLRKLTLWSTYYYVLSAAAVDSGGFPLSDMQGHGLDASLKPRDWCNAAVEGTVAVGLLDKSSRTFNYAGGGSNTVVDCLQFFSRLGPKIGKSRFAGMPKNAPCGLGDASNFRLMPFRSIAVDRSRPEFKLKDGSQLRKTVIFVPELKGAELKMADGSVKTHDGYLFAADTGGAIKGAHIDFFLGVSTRNPAPAVVQSNESATFSAYIIQDQQVRDKLFAMHFRSQDDEEGPNPCAFVRSTNRGGSVSSQDIVRLRRRDPTLDTAISEELGAQRMSRDAPITCTRTRVGRNSAAIGVQVGERVGPYACEVGTRTLEVSGDPEASARTKAGRVRWQWQ